MYIPIIYRLPHSLSHRTLTLYFILKHSHFVVVFSTQRQHRYVCVYIDSSISSASSEFSKCLHYHPGDDDWYILYADGSRKEFTVAFFKQTVASTSCLKHTIHSNQCCSQCVSVTLTKHYSDKVAQMKKIVEKYHLPNPLSTKNGTCIAQLQRFVNVPGHHIKYSLFNADLLDFIRNSQKLKLKAYKSRFYYRRRALKFKKRLVALQKAVKSGNVNAMFEQMGSSFKLLHNLRKEDRDEYVTPLLSELWSSFTLCLDKRGPNGFRRSDLAKKFYFVMHQTSPRGTRLMRDLLGKALVPSKNGLHKPEHGLDTVGVGILKSVIRILPSICKKASYGFEEHSVFTIGPGLIIVSMIQDYAHCIEQLAA